ncbi:MAG: hypothetical protein ACFFAE_15365 [Candidatus Hodarchaeota archaeon]
MKFTDLFFLLSNDYSTDVDLFIAVIFGREELLPWSSTNAGLTHYATNVSELAGLSVITMNYHNIFNNSEGLTLTTLHEIGHLFGLIHPHDYWNPLTLQMEVSWIWGYVSSPMTYLLTDYHFDFFDRLLTWRLQINSLLTSIGDPEFDQEVLNRIWLEIKEGRYLSLEDELIKLREIFKRYKDRIEVNTFLNRITIIGTGSFLLLTIIAIIYFYRTKKGSLEKRDN